MPYINSLPVVSMLTCFKDLSTWPVREAVSRRLVLLSPLKDPGSDQVANKRVVLGVNLKGAGCNLLEKSACSYAAEELVLAASSPCVPELGRAVVAAVG